MQSQFLRTRFRLFVLTLACLGMLAVQSMANAQQRGLAGFGTWQPQLTDGEVKHMDELFELDEFQHDMVVSIIEGYEVAFREAMDDFRTRMSDLRDEMRDQPGERRDWRAMAPRFIDMQREWETEAEELTNQVLTDIKDVLSEEQLELWPTLERDRRRRLTLSSNSQVGGEAVDVIALVEDQELPEESLAAIEDTLESYAVELDVALVERNEAFRGMTSGFERIFGDNPEPENVDEAMDRVRRARIQLRGVNERYVDLIAGQIDTEYGEELKKQFKEKAYPQIYRDSNADRYFARVLRLENLDEGQRDAIEQLEGDYERRVAVVNDKWSAMQRKSDEDVPGFMRGGMQFLRDRRNGQRNAAPDPEWAEQMRKQAEERRQIREDKQSLVEESIEAVWGLLTEEQRTLAPKPEAQGDRRERFMEEMRNRGGGFGGGEGRGGRGGGGGRGFGGG
jgi:hypothetical protein